MKRILSLFSILYFGLFLYAQERQIVNFPDIPGYQTLSCDLHMHTVFSDGSVWPTVRVDEAWKEGIDVIAITDHLEYLPHKKDITADHNRSWEIAQDYAKGKDVIVIAGTEITKNMPPGHFNALFIKDANAIKNDNYKIAIKEATSQGAYIMWNHPGWKAQQPDTMLWWDAHTFLLEQGWMHGIEVANEHEMYPEAINWARDKGLSFMACSDVHSPINMAFDIEGSHRPLTLVFATERSEGGVREALFNGRTIAYFGEMLMGKKALLEAFFLESLYLKHKEGSRRYSFLNPTDISLQLELNNHIYEDWSRSFDLEPGMEIVFSLPENSKIEEIHVTAKNFHMGSDQQLKVALSSIKTIHP